MHTEQSHSCAHTPPSHACALTRRPTDTHAQSGLAATWRDEAVVLAVHNGCHQKVLEDVQDLARHDVATACGAVLGSAEDVIGHPPLQAGHFPGDAQAAGCRAIPRLRDPQLLDRSKTGNHTDAHPQEKR